MSTPTVELTVTRRRLAVGSLAGGAFGIGLTEFAPAGLLPAIGARFGVTDGTSGMVVGAYAVAVAIGAIVMSLLAARLDRAIALRLLVALFILGNLLSALAPTFGSLLLGRVIAALCHGAYMGIAVAVAADLMPRGKAQAAAATVFSGITLAIVLGLPVGTFLGQQLGWRITFGIMTGLGVLVLIALTAWVPRERGRRPSNLRAETHWLGTAQVWATLAVSVLGFGGVFGAFSYLAYTLTDVTGLAPWAVTLVLFGFGLGTAIGNLIGGGSWARRLGDRFLVGVQLGSAAIMIALGLSAQLPLCAVLGVLLLGAVGFSLTPGTQARVLGYAGGAALASSANIAALNLGNWFGASLSGMAIDAGYGATAPLFVGAALSMVGAVVAALAARRAGRR